jgi:predicted PhzF superfamily epimerase YddE/YHI9
VVLTDKDIKKIEEALERAADLVTELGCDSVRFFATGALKGCQTTRITTGRGNWFAQVGVAEDWVQGNRNANLAAEIGPTQEEPPDEDWKG